jgi:molybdate transport system substrate-binding protein
MFLLLLGIRAEAAELKVLSAIGMRQVMLDLGPKFEQTTGHKLAVTFGSGALIYKRIDDGEAVDVVMIPRWQIDKLTATGKVLKDSTADLARSTVAVAVRKGARKPDISSPEALKRTLLAAKSVARPDPAMGGSSGVHIAGILDRLGIANEVNAKTVFGKGVGNVGQRVADGEAEIAMHQIQELMSVPGIEIVGPLPEDLQATFVFSAAIGTGTREVVAAKALIDFLRTPDAAAVIKAKGMEPATP